MIRIVSRGTPQVDVTYPMLWLIVINEILPILDRNGVKVVTYADDLVILVSEMLPSVMSETVEGVLGIDVGSA